MRALLVTLLMACVAFAGCADSGVESIDDTDQQFEDKGLKATATTGVIRGVVVDESITPIAEATIKIKSLGLETTSDENGLFGFSDLEPGAYFLDVTKTAFVGAQTSATVVAGEDKPELVRVMISFDPGAVPFVDALVYKGHLTCGAAIFVTSVGCTTLALVAEQIGDQSIFTQTFTEVPSHAQGELVWKNTQTLAGRFIWEITPGGNTHMGYRETEHSPALAYIDNETIAANLGDIMDENGIKWRFFGGSHDACHGIYGFGCGVTLEQSAEAFIHTFYNMQPNEGWRFTVDGEHPLPS